jgi:transcriptional regulator with XRE-family HTH domain
MKKSPNPIDRHVGGRVRLRRMLLGMSQMTLAEGLGLTFQQVQKYEKGANRIGASRLQQIANILQVPVAFFFDGAPGGSVSAVKPIGDSADPLRDFGATRDGLALALAFNAIADQKVRAALVTMAELYAKAKPPAPAAKRAA